MARAAEEAGASKEADASAKSSLGSAAAGADVGPFEEVLYAQGQPDCEQQLLLQALRRQLLPLQQQLQQETSLAKEEAWSFLWHLFGLLYLRVNFYYENGG